MGGKHSAGHQKEWTSLNLNSEEESALIQVLKEYKDTFAWTYEDMPGLDPALVEHRLLIKLGAKAVKQKL